MNPASKTFLKMYSIRSVSRRVSAEVVPEAELILIAVGTPPKKNGEADTRHVEQAAREVAQVCLPNRHYTLVVKSTVPIGTNQRVVEVVEHVFSERGIQGNISVASNPEFLQEGLALQGAFYPDRIVVGANSDEAVDTLRRLYQPILEQTFDPPSEFPRPSAYHLPPMMTTDPNSAEMIKYAANTFLALKISFINEIAGLCEEVDADVTEVARGIGLDATHRTSISPSGARLGWQLLSERYRRTIRCRSTIWIRDADYGSRTHRQLPTTRAYR